MKKYAIVNADVGSQELNKAITETGGHIKLMTVFIVSPPEFDVDIEALVEQFKLAGFSKSRIHISSDGIPPVNCDMFYLVPGDKQIMESYMVKNVFHRFLIKCMNTSYAPLIPYGFGKRYSEEKPTIIIKYGMEW